MWYFPTSHETQSNGTSTFVSRFLAFHFFAAIPAGPGFAGGCRFAVEVPRCGAAAAVRCGRGQALAGPVTGVCKHHDNNEFYSAVISPPTMSATSPKAGAAAAGAASTAPPATFIRLATDLGAEDEEENPSAYYSHHWTRREKYIWLATLLAGTTAVYASRTTMPLVAPAAARELGWSKTEVGTVLSSFFWGYTLTQVLGGYLSDRYGAERVLLAAGLGWGFITFWFHRLVNVFSDHAKALNFVVMVRVLWGACQGGCHFEQMVGRPY